MSNLMSKSAAIKTFAADATAASEGSLTSSVMSNPLPVEVKTSSETFIDKAKTFLNKEVVAGSKIKWMYVIGAALAFVLYVELVADRKTKRSLKFW